MCRARSTALIGAGDPQRGRGLQARCQRGAYGLVENRASLLTERDNAVLELLTAIIRADAAARRTSPMAKTCSLRPECWSLRCIVQVPPTVIVPRVYRAAL